LAAAIMVQRTSDRPIVCLCIATLEGKARFCRWERDAIHASSLCRG